MMYFYLLFVFIDSLILLVALPAWYGMKNGKTSRRMNMDILEEVEGRGPDSWLFRLQRVFCNFDNNSQLPRGSTQFVIGNIEATYCTDVNYDSTDIQQHHFEAVSRMDVFPHDRNLFLPKYMALNDLKILNPSLRTHLTITESSALTFTTLVLDTYYNRRFVSASTTNLRLWGFDGLILKWMYPPHPGYLTRLLLDLRNEFLLDHKMQKKGAKRLLLGVALTGETGVAGDLYQVYAISQIVDVIVLQLFDSKPITFPNVTGIMTFLYNLRNDPSSRETNASNGTQVAASVATSTSQNKRSRWFPADDSSTGGADDSYVQMQIESLLSQTGMFIIDDTIEEWVLLGAEKSKMVINLSLNGRVYNLINANQTGIGAVVTEPLPGFSRWHECDDKGKRRYKTCQKYTQIFYLSTNLPECADGTLCNIRSSQPRFRDATFYEMCNISQSGTITRVSSADYTPYWFNDSVWITYEDMDSIRQKVEYLRDHHLLGVMLSSMSDDDFRGDYCGLGEFPVSRLAHNLSRVYLEILVPVGTPDWATYCNKGASIVGINSGRLLLLMFLNCLL